MNKKSRGYSLIELLAVLAIIAVLSVIITALIVWEMKAYRKSQDIINAQENAAKAMREFEKIARGSTEVTTSQSSEYGFYTYLTNDVQPAPSKVRLLCQNGDFSKGVINPSGDGPSFDYLDESEVIYKIAEDVSNCNNLFRYYNDANQEVGQPVPVDVVRMVKVTITADKASWEIPEEISESTTVSLRNLKTNL